MQRETKSVSLNEAQLLLALEESIKLQSHYAKLLNQYDGGTRISFSSPEEFMERLRSIDRLTTHYAAKPPLDADATHEVRWVMQVTAETARHAAELALEIQRDPDSIATVFEVIDANGLIVDVDVGTQAWGFWSEADQKYIGKTYSSYDEAYLDCDPRLDVRIRRIC